MGLEKKIFTTAGAEETVDSAAATSQQLAQNCEVRGILFKQEDGSIIEEVIGNGYKTMTK